MDRCPNCDSRYCGPVCLADNVNFVYVTGKGFIHWTDAFAYEDRGHRVDWRRSRVPKPVTT